jgi:hypothetical protein
VQGTILLSATVGASLIRGSAFARGGT